MVIDSLGVGQMDDVAAVRFQDTGANTLKHVSEFYNDYRLPILESLGAGYIADSKNITKVERVRGSYGCSNLAHEGADTYQGHQEIVGSKPRQPLIKPFKSCIEKVRETLIKAGYSVVIPEQDHPFLLVNNLVTIADNIEADLGLNYNVTAPLDYISFAEELDIGNIVRNNVEVGRVIVLGGRGISVENILDAVEIISPDFVGINCPKSGVYKSGYMVRHLGYGINPSRQLPTILINSGYKVSLIGKAADVINCEGADYIPAVDTASVLQLILDQMAEQQNGLIMANVQETDLAGHAENVGIYAAKLKITDRFIGEIMAKMQDDDLLFITGDHGNDPTIGHSHHTREKAFLIVYGKKINNVYLGERKTLADIGASIADYFGVSRPEFGESFWGMLRKSISPAVLQLGTLLH